MQGMIIRIISNLYTVKCEDGIYECRARGKFRNDHITPMVGDYVFIQDHYIMKVLPRKNSLVRPPLSNIDQVMIVTSLKKPDLSLYLLDKFISIAEFHRMKAMICFTKADLLNDCEKKEIAAIKRYYESIGYEVYYNDQISEIKETLQGKLTVLAGQTGSGKSSLLNRMDSTLNLKTNEISEALGRGKHTTRHVELFEIAGGLVSDTPGFSSLELIDMDNLAIRDSFVEFQAYRCKYRDCFHIHEDGCAVKEQVGKTIRRSRYENYQNFIEKK